MTQQLTTLTHVRQVMVYIYNEYSTNMEQQGLDPKPCQKVAASIASMTDEASYQAISYLEEKVLKALRCYNGKLERAAERLAGGSTNRFWQGEHDKATQLVQLLTVSLDIVQTWLDSNTPESDILNVMEAIVSCDQSVPPAGVTRSIHEELDIVTDEPKSGPMFDR